jgi:hypothetical protein
LSMRVLWDQLQPEPAISCVAECNVGILGRIRFPAEEVACQ